MSKIKMVTVKELVNILWNFKTQPGASIIAGLTQLTDPRMRKTGNPYLGTMKLTTLTILLNTDYETGVVKQLDREGKEETEYKRGKNTMPLIFGENNRFIGMYEKETGFEYVLQYRPFDNSKPQTSYIFEGNPIEKSLIESFLPKTYKAENQGTEKNILWRKVYLSNVLNLNFDGERYQLIHT